MLKKIEHLIKLQKETLKNQSLSQLPKPLQIQYCRTNKKMGELAYKAYEKLQHNPGKALKAANYFVIALEQSFPKAIEKINGQLSNNNLNEGTRNVEPLNTAEETFKLGVCYFLGIADYKKNVTIAVKLFKSAAAHNLAIAINFLGFIYSYRKKNTKDNMKALKCFRLAAELGHAYAQNNLGYMCQHGQGMAADEQEAIQWYRLAAEKGNAYAQNNLGYICQHSTDTALKEAVKWYRLAALQGLSVAQFNLGAVYEHGQGVKQDTSKALKWYRLAAKQNFAPAQNSLGAMYEQGIGVPQDYKIAADWYRLAAELGYAPAQNSLGCMYQEGMGVKKNKKKALQWYWLAAGQHYASAYNNLGHLYQYCIGVPNVMEALKWYRGAAELGNVAALINLGYTYDKGKGLPKDESEALKWYRLAAEKDNQDVYDLIAKKTSFSARYHHAMLDNNEKAVINLLLAKASLSIELLFDIERSFKNELLFETVVHIISKLKEKKLKVNIYETAINLVRIQKLLATHQAKIDRDECSDETILAILKDINFSEVTSEHIQPLLTLLTDNWYAITNTRTSNMSAITRITANYLTRLIYLLKSQEKPTLDSYTINQCLVILIKDYLGPQYQFIFITPDLDKLTVLLAFIQTKASIEKITQYFDKNMFRKVSQPLAETTAAKTVINQLTEYLKNCLDKIAIFPYLKTIYDCLNNNLQDEQHLLEQLQSISKKYSFPSNTWFIKKDEQLKQIHHFLKSGDIEGLNQFLDASLMHTSREIPSRDR